MRLLSSESVFYSWRTIIDAGLSTSSLIPFSARNNISIFLIGCLG